MMTLTLMVPMGHAETAWQVPHVDDTFPIPRRALDVDDEKSIQIQLHSVSPTESNAIRGNTGRGMGDANKYVHTYQHASCYLVPSHDIMTMR